MCVNIVYLISLNLFLIMFWFLIASVAVVSIWFNLIKPMSHFRKIGVKQTNAWPILGNLWSVVNKSYAEAVTKAYNMYPEARYMGFYQFSLPALILKDPELIKQITVKNFECFTDHRPFVNPETDQLWSNNLFALEGQKWREMRTLLSGTFTTSKLKHIFDIINETAENFVDYFKNKTENLIEIEMKDAFTRFANDVIATTAFGLEVDSLNQPNNKFFLMGKRVTNFGKLVTSLKFLVFFVAPNLYKFFKISIFPTALSQYFENIINETIKMREDMGIVRQDVINLLLEATREVKSEETDKDKYIHKQLSNKDITSQAIIFFIAGFETISTSLAFATYELALNKAIQNKLRKEIIETHKYNNCKLSYYSLLNMRYMDMVFSEVLRKWPPVITVDRTCTKPYTIKPVNPAEKPVHLKVGDVIWLPIYPLQRDPKYHPDPERFDPDRFSSKNKDKIIPYSYIPFGSGPRNCIGSRFAGLEAKVVIYHLLLNFEIISTRKTQIPLKLAARSPLPKAEKGYWLALKRL